LTLLLRLLTGFAFLLLIIGTIISSNTLSNIQFPSGDWYSTGNPSITDISKQDAVGPWLIGKAVGWSIAGAVLSGVACYFVGLIWEEPRVGVDDDAEVGHSVTGAAPKGEHRDGEVLDE
jgi:hypothetical protein